MKPLFLVWGICFFTNVWADDSVLNQAPASDACRAAMVRGGVQIQFTLNYIVDDITKYMMGVNSVADDGIPVTSSQNSAEVVVGESGYPTSLTLNNSNDTYSNFYQSWYDNQSHTIAVQFIQDNDQLHCGMLNSMVFAAIPKIGYNDGIYRYFTPVIKNNSYPPNANTLNGGYSLPIEFDFFFIYNNCNLPPYGGIVNPSSFAADDQYWYKGAELISPSDFQTKYGTMTQLLGPTIGGFLSSNNPGSNTISTSSSSCSLLSVKSGQTEGAQSAGS